MHHSLNIALVLLAVAVGVTALAKKIKKPYPIALVIVGGIIGLVPVPELEPLKGIIQEGYTFQFIIISLLLPTLLGEASIKLPFSHLRDHAKPIIALALGGTFLTFIIVGAGSYYVLGLGLQTAFVFAALMSATDPVSVLSIFKSLGVNRKLSTIIEGESLFNDGLAVVLFMIASIYLPSYIEMGAGGFVSALLMLLKVSIGGVLVGGGLGYIFSKFTSWYDDYPLEILFSILLFYGSFLIAESIHVSGVIAVVVAGLTFGNYGAKIGMSPTTKINIHSFWDVLALFANSLVFLLVGLEIAYININDKWGLIISSILIVLIARTIAVYGTLFTIKGIPTKWKHVLNWGGLKGSLSIALALSLPNDFPGREDIIILAFSVVFFSLLAQGMTISALISRLKIKGSNKEKTEYEEVITAVNRYDYAIQRLYQLKKEAIISSIVFEKWKALYVHKSEESKKRLDEMYEQHPEWRKSQEYKATIETLYAEHEAVENLLRKDMISSQQAEEEVERILDKIEQQRTHYSEQE
ncbi:sodium:proton antiporter [Fictibacillus phosphorivorans]|uniref:Sodium:proton antiporter n=1 Tax=Fictibacillus phosphorivorans TaxID=1221500 RepID=A0A163SD91_9BACL|nr:cation:proton antiporter [Fictibacillus phosphorivorans]KZE68788.1 sodium:proton antiporter [Fictibacillus phosphorivorans]